jgi:ABC-2 type transport system permease protein
MRNIIKSDFYKLKESRAFWICVLIIIGFSFLSVNVYQSVIKRALNNPNDTYHVSMTNMATIVSGAWTLEYFAAMAFQFVIVGIFIATFLAPEFNSGTIKNVLSRGANRTKVFLSKFLVCACASVLMTVLYILTMLLAGTVVWGFDQNGIFSLTGLIRIMSIHSLMAVAFAALFTFVSMTIRSYGLAMAAIMMSVIMGGKMTGAIGSLAGVADLDQYWLEWAVSSMATYTPASNNIVQAVIVALGWGITSVIAGSVLFEKRDVK